ncbi:COG3942 and LysM peptidoglycan-binding domain-containing protein [Streptococcus oricebi]|uniref:Hydrolase n=1 Tax=Streptococcus oricebi TaxID=1547447 RepID=A0ABS5B4L3_9STRE|nr:CHAP domain-containing protein [Streptococcus oricebi]MBP2623776.1 hydrolase [Streptococcus oricebi]
MRKHLEKVTIGLSSALAVALLSQQSASADSYVVQAGDSFYSIASLHGMSPYDLAAKNGKTIYDTILPGDTLQVDGASQGQVEAPAQATSPAASDLVSDTEDVVLNTPTATGNSYPIGQCTWGVKELAPWASNWWGNAKDWTANAAASGFATGTTPMVGAIAVWDGGDYGHVAYVTDVASGRSIQVLEANYNRHKQINNYRGWFDPTTFYGRVTYIYPNY